jgi:hypothetical protein
MDLENCIILSFVLVHVHAWAFMMSSGHKHVKREKLKESVSISMFDDNSALGWLMAEWEMG